MKDILKQIMMVEIQDNAILMHSYRYRENDLITLWFCHGYGLQKALLRRQQKRHYELDLYSINVLQMKKSSSSESDLHWVNNIEPVKRFTQSRSDYSKLLISSYFGSLIEYWVDLNQAEEELYKLFERALHYIDDQTVEWKAVTYFERELSRILGYGNNPTSLMRLYTASKKNQDLRARIQHILV